MAIIRTLLSLALVAFPIVALRYGPQQPAATTGFVAPAARAVWGAPLPALSAKRRSQGIVRMDNEANSNMASPDLFNDMLSLPPDIIAIRRPPGSNLQRASSSNSVQMAAAASTNAEFVNGHIVEAAPIPHENGIEKEEEAGEEDYENSPSSYANEVTPFIEMFRDAASYIRMHRGQVMVLHLQSDLISSPMFEKVMDDVAFMSLLGVKMVMVVSVASQVDRRLATIDLEPCYCGDLRVTNADTLRIIKEEAGFARCEIESALSRGFKGRPGTMGINVVGGNFFYSAKPYGVIDGVDFGYTGEVRKVDRESIMTRLNQGDVVLLTAVGYSASGQAFNVMSECLATEVAAALEAAKLIFVTRGESLIDTRTNNVIQSMRLRDAKAFLAHHNVDVFPQSVTQACVVKGKVILTPTRHDDSQERTSSIMRFTRYSVQGLLKGVKRAHLVAPGNGKLLEEVFTRDGAGTLICGDLYDGIRPSRVEDVPSIMDMIQPLIDEKILYKRSKSELEKNIHEYYVFVRDGHIIACGQLRKFDGAAEIACLAVHPSYRKGGRGDAMLAYLERLAVGAGLNNLFVLSTRTMQWFSERGFQEVAVDALPKERQLTYNWERKSKIYMKKLTTTRDVDAEELFWDVSSS